MRDAWLHSSLDNRACASAHDIDPEPWHRYAHRMRVRDIITEKLTKAFAPLTVEVLDESAQHEGHAGARPGGQTHFRIHIVAEAFKDKSRIERHRMINSVLADELGAGVHALAIHAAAPGEVRG
jgi:BolA family transcriptional regulator, general stress-responsive regulator